MSVEDKLKVVASSALEYLFSSHAVTTPISSFDLLTRVVASSPPPPGLVPGSGPAPKFRLIDLARFERILERFAESWNHGKITLSREDDREGGMTIMEVRLGSAASEEPVNASPTAVRRKRKRVVDEDDDSAADGAEEEETPSPDKEKEGALWRPRRTMKEVYESLRQSSAKGKLLAEQFRTIVGSFEPICPHITKDECARARREGTSPTSPNKSVTTICDRIHFRPLLRAHTDPSLGHCSYLNTCYSEPTYAQSPSIPPLPSHRQIQYGAQGQGPEKAPCRYLHFEVDWDLNDGHGMAEQRTVPKRRPYRLKLGLGPEGKLSAPLPPQWINCDLRRFDYSVLGKFHVIMADPPWDIHMSLPYGTMTDDEMRAMPIPTLQDEGVLFLWVTGRAMEVGRECLRVWGYTRVDEVVWVKTNQLQRVIRTGRTGHWLNHTKEHMLVGVKTVTDENGQLKFPSWVNRGLDTDVIVSEVRETSRKPDEAYGLIERMCPGGRKIEIFGRKHNTRPGWLTLGNQLGADQIYEEDLRARIQARYPERILNPPPHAFGQGH
ncbi:MT-A70-domain-containing protein [Daedaleopsis nitida]|nr:MT-A70-domain-containing protein [Daedaleopsis nitida]